MRRTNSRNHKRAAEKVARFFEYGAQALAVLAALAMVAIVALVFLGVVMRRVADAPLFFTEEAVGLLMSVALFLALPLITLRNSHIRVTLLEAHLPQTAQRVLAVVAALVGVVFTGWLTYEAVPWMQFALRLQLKTETARVFLPPFMALLPLGVGLSGLIFLMRAFGLLERPRSQTDNQAG